MDAKAVADSVKKIIGNVTGISPESIADSAAFVDDLGLDSLSILEIAVDIEKAFKIKASEEELMALRSIEDSVAFILQRTSADVVP